MPPWSTRPWRPNTLWRNCEKRARNLAKLRKNQHLFLALTQLVAELRQTLKLAALRRRKVARADQMVRMVADLLELHELGQDDSPAFDAVGIFKFLFKIAHGLLVKGSLFAAQRTKGRHLNLLGEVGDDALVGLERRKMYGPTRVRSG